jgi:hypothetical protein
MDWSIAGARRGGDLGNPHSTKMDRELHRELGWKAGEENVLDITIDDELPAYIKDERSIANWYYVRDLRRALVSAT